MEKNFKFETNCNESGQKLVLESSKPFENDETLITRVQWVTVVAGIRNCTNNIDKQVVIVHGYRNTTDEMEKLKYTDSIENAVAVVTALDEKFGFPYSFTTRLAK